MTSIVDYPPLALYELAAAGLARRVLYGEVRGLRGDIYAVKLLAFGASALIGISIWWMVRRRRGRARRGMLLYWTNPAAILHTAYLGYVGTIATLPALLALAAAEAGWTATGGFLLTAGMLTKPQAVFVLPGLLLLTWHRGGARQGLARAVGGGALAVLAIVAPVIHAGAGLPMLRAIFGLISGGTLSAQAANVWWIVSYAIAARQRMALGAAAPWLGRTPMLSIGDVLGDGWEVVAGAASWTAVLLVVVWGAARTRHHPTIAAAAAVSALTVHAYFMLAMQVHENHLFLALPLLAIVAAADRRYLGVLAAVSAVGALNLYLFYGVSGGDRLSSRLTGVDPTVVLAAAGVFVFLWHLRVFAASSDAMAADAPLPSGNGAGAGSRPAAAVLAEGSIGGRASFSP